MQIFNLWSMFIVINIKMIGDEFFFSAVRFIGTRMLEWPKNDLLLTSFDNNKLC